MVGSETTTKRRNDLIEMFLDATAGEVYANGRLKTRESEEGTVQLIAYHTHLLAEVDRGSTEITLFTGHYGNVSPAVSRYLHFVGKCLNKREGFDVTVLEGHAPNVRNGMITGAAQYIQQYINTDTPLSGAEKKAIDEVNSALKRAL